MNLYNIYSEPKVLTGYADQDLLPQNVYKQARRGQQLTPVQWANMAQDPKWSYLYAYSVLEGPWPPGEAAIAASPEWAYKYARYVISGPWPQGEAAIAQDPDRAFFYARELVGSRWPAGEAAMQQDPDVWRTYQVWLNRQRQSPKTQ